LVKSLALENWNSICRRWSIPGFSSKRISGGGKSWLLRLIAERAGIQTIVLDNEGEFASLREAVDVLLVGASGELPTNPRHAALLARRLLEYKVSAVIDLYELKLAERRRFVKLFLESLIHLPRDLWRPTLVILDEAHIYCPERGSGEAESTEPVISLMSQGRKRGYAGIIATQRLSKLHKDAAAEANNVIIGRTWLDARREWCISARTVSGPRIRAPASAICLRRRRHHKRFAECWASLPTCHTRRKRKSEASMRRAVGSLSLSAKSKAPRALG